MNLAEFKAWFEGYTEDLKDAPSNKQWERIKARVAEIDGKAITQTVYLDRYVRPYWRDYYGTIYSGAAGVYSADLSAVGQNTCQANVETLVNTMAVSTAHGSFEPIEAMYAAGKAEALAA